MTYLKKCRCKIWCLLICTFSKELVALGYVHFHLVCHDFYKITPHTTYFSGENIFLYIRPVINQADSWGLRHPPSPSLPHSCSPSPSPLCWWPLSPCWSPHQAWHHDPAIETAATRSHITLHSGQSRGRKLNQGQRGQWVCCSFHSPWFTIFTYLMLIELVSSKS